MGREREMMLIMCLVAQATLGGCAPSPSPSLVEMELTARAESTRAREEEEELEQSVCPTEYNLWPLERSLMIGVDKLKFMGFEEGRQDQGETGEVWAKFEAEIPVGSPTLEWGFPVGLTRISVPLTGDQFEHYFPFWDLEVVLAKASEELPLNINTVCYRFGGGE